jgi:hypothetical protein
MSPKRGGLLKQAVEKYVEPIREALKKSDDYLMIQAQRIELERLRGVLDIIVRENAGEPDDELAIEYGGTGYEKHPAVESTRRIRAELREALDPQ